MRWRVESPGGAVDLTLLDVPYEDAVTIVQALKQRSMAERCPAWSNAIPPMPTTIRRPPDPASAPLLALVPGLGAMKPQPPGVYLMDFAVGGGGAFTTATIAAADVRVECGVTVWQR